MADDAHRNVNEQELQREPFGRRTASEPREPYLEHTPTAVNQALLRQANFDPLGRTTIATRAAGQVLDRWVTGYQYDARGRLTFVGDTLYHYPAGSCTGPPIVDPDYGIKPCTAAGMTKTLQYVDTVGYDVVGNIVKNTAHGGTGTATYDAANRLTAWPGLSRLTSDADGNLTSRTVTAGATTNYFWSPDGLLDSVKTSTGGSSGTTTTRSGYWCGGGRRPARPIGISCGIRGTSPCGHRSQPDSECAHTFESAIGPLAGVQYLWSIRPLHDR